MNKNQLVIYLGRIDAALHGEAILHIIRERCFHPAGRTGADEPCVDVAAPYCHVDERAFRSAAALAGLPVNPEFYTADDHIEWISSLRLCLPKPSPDSDIVLWRGHPVGG